MLERRPKEIKWTYDKEADASYIYLGEQPIKSARSVEIAHDIYVELDIDGRLLGIEVLDSRLLPKGFKPDGGDDGGEDVKE